jgi:hypothetical protein
LRDVGPAAGPGRPAASRRRSSRGRRPRAPSTPAGARLVSAARHAVLRARLGTRRRTGMRFVSSGPPRGNLLGGEEPGVVHHGAEGEPLAQHVHCGRRGAAGLRAGRGVAWRVKERERGREEERKRAREQERKRGREQESKRAREQESKRAREQESKRRRAMGPAGRWAMRDPQPRELLAPEQRHEHLREPDRTEARLRARLVTARCNPPLARDRLSADLPRRGRGWAGAGGGRMGAEEAVLCEAACEAKGGGAVTVCSGGSGAPAGGRRSTGRHERSCGRAAGHCRAARGTLGRKRRGCAERRKYDSSTT